MAQRGRLAVLKVGGITIDLVRDVTNDLTASEIDTTSRSTTGWKTFLQGLKEMGISFEMIHDPSNAGFGVLETGFDTGNSVTFSVLDKFGSGYTGTAVVTGFTRSEPLDGVITQNVTIKPDSAVTIINTGS